MPERAMAKTDRAHRDGKARGSQQIAAVVVPDREEPHLRRSLSARAFALYCAWSCGLDLASARGHAPAPPRIGEAIDSFTLSSSVRSLPALAARASHTGDLRKPSLRRHPPVGGLASRLDHRPSISVAPRAIPQTCRAPLFANTRNLSPHPRIDTRALASSMAMPNGSRLRTTRLRSHLALYLRNFSALLLLETYFRLLTLHKSRIRSVEYELAEQNSRQGANPNPRSRPL